MKILHAASECFPFAKTGGLGDVLSSLPPALGTLGTETRVCIPAYRGAWQHLADQRTLPLRLEVGGFAFRAVEGTLSTTGQRMILMDCPVLFDRPGDPYHDDGGVPWDDNPRRFGCFSAAIAQLAAEHASWRPDIVHLHDWQAGLAAPWLSVHGAQRPRVVFTIHNLAYQGVYGRDQFEALHLPQQWWQIEGIEFWGGMSFMKGGLNFSDAITTVSPTYAREIRDVSFGHGLDGVLRAKEKILSGIVNGIDAEAWNPETDPHLHRHYSLRTVVAGKRANKEALLSAIGLPAGDEPLLVFIGRFAEQKGADLLLEAGDALLMDPLRIAVLGTGDRTMERAFAAWATRRPDRVAVCLRHDEALAHRFTAAADLQLMPSRYEPCGLNQMYAQRYGTIPVVRRTGGLADTVIDANEASIADGSASGIHFEHADAGGVIHGVRRGLELIGRRKLRSALQHAGMTRDFSWLHSAREYVQLYERLLAA